jgi:hypothetical protein
MYSVFTKETRPGGVPDILAVRRLSQIKYYYANTPVAEVPAGVK